MALQEPDALAKTNRINLLFDFYEPLLTEKQRTFLKYYFHDDYTLGEIAAEFDVSRQAVYEHIKRAESVLEGYEGKLRLLARHEAAADLLSRLDAIAESISGQETAVRELKAISRRLREMDVAD